MPVDTLGPLPCPGGRRRQSSPRLVSKVVRKLLRLSHPMAPSKPWTRRLHLPPIGAIRGIVGPQSLRAPQERPVLAISAVRWCVLKTWRLLICPATGAG